MLAGKQFHSFTCDVIDRRKEHVAKRVQTRIEIYIIMIKLGNKSIKYCDVIFLVPSISSSKVTKKQQKDQKMPEIMQPCN